MRLRAIFREVKHDVLTGTAHVVSFSFVLTLIATCLGLADMIQINSLMNAAKTYQAAGASVSVLSAPGQINGAACEALSGLPGISSSGALRDTSDKVQFTVLKAAPVSIFTVTPGFATLLEVDTEGGDAGVYLSDQVTDVLQVKPGATLASNLGPVEVGGTYVYPEDGRTRGYGYAALIPSVDNEPYDECWANVWPQTDATQALMYTAVLAGRSDESAPIVIGQLNTTLGVKFAGESLYNERVTKYAVVVAGIASLAVGYIYVRMRRLEIASNLHAGVARSDQAVILGLEVAAWLVTALVLAQSVLVFYAVANSSADSGTLVAIASRNLFVAGVGVVVGALAAWFSTRERHLFRYFKDR